MVTDDIQQLPDAIADRVFELLGEDPATAESGLAALCADHPEHAELIRRTVAAADAAAQEMTSAAGVVGTHPSSRIPDRVGPFRIRSRLGHGGMGTVYLAEQDEVAARPVALKVIRRGLPWEQLLQRFELERAALTRLDHPGIARLLTAGAGAEGEPYFAMEYVDGDPIDAYCARHKLGLRDRLRLFVLVCEGLQHAHDHGIVHRDLKPSNILVAAGQPRVIDFGIARMVTGDDPRAVHMQLTEPGDVLGTPGYMSPEQLDGSGAIDTRSDVWGLGVVLFQTLTGQLPFAIPRAANHRAAMEAALDHVATTDAKAPSTLVDLCGDVDAIVLQALQRAPHDRYQSAAEFAADLRAFLEHRPVTARRPTAIYRIRRFARRHAVGVTTGALVTVLAVAGLVGSAIGRGQAETSRRAALAEQQRASRAAAAAHRHKQRFDLLAWRVKLDQARQLATELHPARPELVPRMRAWLSEHGEPLAKAREPIAQALAELDDKALSPAQVPRGDSTRTELRQRQRRVKALETVATARLTPAVRDAIPVELAQHRSRITELRAEIEARNAMRFAHGADQVLHDTLTKVVSDLETFIADDLPALRARVEWAETLRERTVRTFAPQWREAIAAIAVHPRYRGLKLAPQLGLIPLGADPESQLFEFAHPRSGPVPHRDPTTRRLTYQEDSCIVFVLLPPTTFTMGAQRNLVDGSNHDPHALPNEGPPHRIGLDAFFLAKHELTQSQWLRLVGGANPSTFFAGRKLGSRSAFTARHPVENVSWSMAELALRRHALTLPTEAQWEYGCRAGTDSRWWFGDDPREVLRAENHLDRQGRILLRRPIGDAGNDGYPLHAPVGSFAANPFGLHDLHGNVAEWCLDPFCGFDEHPPRPGDGLRGGSTSAGTRGRCLRGGHMASTPRNMRSALRRGPLPGTRSYFNGLRPARRIEP